MNREFLAKVLDDCDGVDGNDSVYTTSEEVTLAVLLASGQAGTAPINRVNSVSLRETYFLIGADDTTYYFPYELVCGIKTAGRGKNATRTGFHA